MRPLPLSGEWYYEGAWGKGTVSLPALLDGAFFGRPGETPEGELRLRKEVTLSRRQAKREALLYLEQPGALALWVNGEEAGFFIRRYAPLTVTLTPFLKPGKNQIEIRQDGGQNPSGWGLFGRLEIQFPPKAAIAGIRVGDGWAALRPAGIQLGNITLEIANKAYYQAFSQETWVEVAFETKRIKRWSPQTPRLYRLNCVLTSPDWKEIKRELWVGLRRLEMVNGALCADGEPVYLIGRALEKCPSITPLAGVEAWRARLQLEKAHGVNLLLCSGWVPPEEAFEAADQAGLFWAVVPPGAEVYAGEEARRREEAALLEQYGVHPSFAMAAVPDLADGSEQAYLPVLPAQEGMDLLLKGKGGALRLAVAPEPEDPLLWKPLVEQALLRRECAGILLKTEHYPDEYPQFKGFSGWFYRDKAKPTLRWWRQFCSDLTLLLEDDAAKIPCGGRCVLPIWVRNCRKPFASCTLRWSAGGASGTISGPLPLGLHKMGEAAFSPPGREGPVLFTLMLEEAGCQNSWAFYFFER